MYVKHQPLIARHAQTAQGFADVVTFVIATENQHFYRVGDILTALAEKGLDDCPYLNTVQKRGIAYAQLRAADYVHLARRCPQDSIGALKALLEIPAIGIVKAGFLWQLIAGRVGCLDRHNLKTAGLAARAFARVPQSTEGLTQRLQTYLATCEALGGSEALYNGWCCLIATKYPQRFVGAYDVSYRHALWCAAID